jgi:hypothetical protein
MLTIRYAHHAHYTHHTLYSPYAATHHTLLLTIHFYSPYATTHHTLLLTIRYYSPYAILTIHYSLYTTMHTHYTLLPTHRQQHHGAFTDGKRLLAAVAAALQSSAYPGEYFRELVWLRNVAGIRADGQGGYVGLYT